jgi:AbrB family looped-hinge helix DNA binding protein
MTAIDGATPVRTRIGQRGTLVIPASLRRRLGLNEGTLVVTEERDGGLFVRSAAVEDLTDSEREQILNAANSAYAALRADPEAWETERSERAAWQRVAGETWPHDEP